MTRRLFAGQDLILDYIRHLEGTELILTGAGADCDCASRYFAPHCGIDEDPVTGAAHCTIIPYWAARLAPPVFTRARSRPAAASYGAGLPVTAC